MTAITLKKLTKRFGPTTAVDAVDLRIESGELFFLLGPSGCGKTTLLRMIAGFIEPTGGGIDFGDRDVTNLPPNKRNTGMVFQSYALWPHMTVFDNVVYGLTVRKVASKQKHDRAMAALKMVQMDELAKRKPNQLSGGQQQRVALARALVIEPTVLLLDEPLSNLDAKLRLEMRSEIKRICKATKITTVYVTHDQTEAMSMADTVAVMRQGIVVQTGPPRELYGLSRTRFVAEFLGETNFLTGVVRSVEAGVVELETAAGVLKSAVGSINASTAEGSKVTCSIRPEALRIVEASAGEHENTLAGKRVQTTFLGEVARHEIAIKNGVTLKVLELNPSMETPDESSCVEVRLQVSARDVVILED